VPVGLNNKEEESKQQTNAAPRKNLENSPSFKKPKRNTKSKAN